MGQYWRIVNVDKKEYLDPYMLGSGAKLWEQLADEAPSKALLVLVANMPESRGGGDLEENEVIGRWAGDRIIVVGDYAENGDHPKIKTEPLYGRCDDVKYKNISKLVWPVLEKELNGKFVQSNWSVDHYYWEPQGG